MNRQYIDFNEYWSYPLQWIEETRLAREDYQQRIYRVDKAMEGLPGRNLYQEELTSNLAHLSQDDQVRIHNAGCDKVKPGKSFILRKAVETRASQMASGVDVYEYQVNDPYGIIDGDTEDKLAAECEQDYVNNGLGNLASTFSRDLTKYGMTAVLVHYDQAHEKNVVERVNPKNVWVDTMYSSTGNERFRGYSTMISWAKLKKIILHEKDVVNTTLEVPDKSILNKNGIPDKHIKVGTKKITDLNDLDIYVNDMNKLATSPSLQGRVDDFGEYDHALRQCYNLNYYRTYANDAKAMTESGYNGQDVELTVIYDLTRKIEFKVINRRYVISANHDAFCREIVFDIYNPITDEMQYKADTFELGCPLKFQFENSESRDESPYPISPVMTYLSTHDELCAWRARRDHVSKILSVLRIVTNGADADSLRKTLNIMGGIYDDIQGDIQTITLNYDYTAIDSQIQYLEDTIKKGLSAYDDYDVLQMMGDRASAAESGMANGAIAQGLAVHQNAVMKLYADIARQCIGNRVVYSSLSEFPVNNKGNSSTVTIQQMALDAVINVRSVMSKRAYERALASNSLALLGTLGQSLPDDAMKVLMSEALLGQVPRGWVDSWTFNHQTNQKEVETASLRAQNHAEALRQNNASYLNDPLSYETSNAMSQLTPDQTDTLISDLSSDQGQSTPVENPNTDEAEDQTAQQGGVMPNPLDMPEQEGAMQLSGMEGLTPESGSALANPNGNY